MVMVMGSSTQALLHLLHAAQWLAGEDRLQVSMERIWGRVQWHELPCGHQSHMCWSPYKFFRVSLTARFAACFPTFSQLVPVPFAAQHLCVNLFHLMDALDLEGVPDLEMSSEPQKSQNLAELHLGWSARPQNLPHLDRGPGVPLKCTRDGPIASICYPDIGIGWNNAGAQGHKECQVGNED